MPVVEPGSILLRGPEVELTPGGDDDEARGSPQIHATHPSDTTR